MKTSYGIRRKPTLNMGDICPDCEKIGLPGAMCPLHAAAKEMFDACTLIVAGADHPSNPPAVELATILRNQEYNVFADQLMEMLERADTAANQARRALAKVRGKDEED